MSSYIIDVLWYLTLDLSTIIGFIVASISLIEVLAGNNFFIDFFKYFGIISFWALIFLLISILISVKIVSLSVSKSLYVSEYKSSGSPYFWVKSWSDIEFKIKFSTPFNGYIVVPILVELFLPE